MGIPRDVRLTRVYSQARELAAAVTAARRAHGSPAVGTVTRARRLRRGAGFTYDEALRTGLLDPVLSNDVAARFVSKDAVSRLSDRLNPRELTTLTEEKAMFYRVCAAIGIPTPILYGIVGRAGGWSSAGGAVPVGAAATAVFLATQPPDEFVVKPSGGYHGLGVRVLRRDGGMLVDLADARTTPAALAEDLCGDPDWDLFVVQERLRNHPGLDAVCRAETLQTLRVTTFVAEDGAVQVVHAGMKLALGGGNVDNFRQGTTGNALCEVDVAEGELDVPMVQAANGIGLTPASGDVARARGTRLPEWPAVRDLVRGAARSLMPRRNIGWDVAITTRGPVIIEANRSYDPWPSPRFGDVVRAIERAVDERSHVRGVPVA